MKLFRSHHIVTVAFVILCASFLSAQQISDFGTPQGTNALAASAGFVDILGIKLGMPAEQALATLKAAYPASKITLGRTRDYETVWRRVEQENPKHQWVSQIDADLNGQGDKVSVGLTLPPSKQVVASIGRESYLGEPVAIENIVESLRKKYGQETYGVNYQMGPITPFDGSGKQFLWVFDPHGNRVKPEAITKNATLCAAHSSGNMAGPQLTLEKNRPYEPATLSNNPCSPYVILSAYILTMSPAPGLAGQTRSFTVVVYDWPLISSGANALYAFLDQSARELAAKQDANAKKRGGEIKY
ncbi:MAG TPA: hypothetical protein VGI16_11515 [Candidatus Acidoferrum sp.]|jgi:hypothetical protein